VFDLSAIPASEEGFMSNFDDMDDQFAGGGWQGKSTTTEPERWLMVNQLIDEKDAEIAALKQSVGILLAGQRECFVEVVKVLFPDAPAFDPESPTTEQD
jgi:hypothetical protein